MYIGYCQAAKRTLERIMSAAAQRLVEKSKKVLSTASNYQTDILEHIAEQLIAYKDGKPTRSLLVKAGAGSGKTLTIVAAAQMIPATVRAIFLAFNKDIATELGRLLPKNVQSKTLNSLGWSICKRFADGVNGHPIEFKDFTNGFKHHAIIRETFTKPEVNEYGVHIRWVVSMCQSLGVVPSGRTDVVGVAEYDDSDISLNAIVERFDYDLPIPVRSKVFNMARVILNKTIDNVIQVNFDEQKYFPVVMPEMAGLAPKYDIVMIDEAQDMNDVDIALIKMILKLNGIVVSVGDNRQSIYGFRGADTQAIEKIKAAFGADELPLSISYRCAVNIVNEARTIYPELESAPNAIDGVVETLGSYEKVDFNAGDMVICRNNAPTIRLAYRLIANRVPVFVKGRDIGRKLISVIDKLKAVDVADLALSLRTWLLQQSEIIRNENPDDEDAIQRITDRYDSIMVFIEHNADGLVVTIIEDIEELFSTRTKDSNDAMLMRGRVVLSSIHKSKGLEAERVYILDRELIGMRATRGTWQMEQEDNLAYVAITRAKRELYYIKTPSENAKCR